MAGTFRLESPRLILRPFMERDCEPFSRYRSDPEAARYQGWETPYSLEQARDFLEEMNAAAPGTPGQWYAFALERKDGGEMIGDCAWKLLAEDARQAEIGYTLARPWQGQGYASEAVTCLIDFLFDQFGLQRVRANIDPRNLPSARLLERVGMRFEGRFVDSLWFKGGWVSEDWYAILRREWLLRQGRSD
jgi:RimJ/RimL family protein N-acetyltransferase